MSNKSGIASVAFIDDGIIVYAERHSLVFLAHSGQGGQQRNNPARLHFVFV
jgi:hypothetical protein